MELQRQKEIIGQWLQTPGIPTDAHAKLLDMLSEVNAQMRTNRFVTSTRIAMVHSACRPDDKARCRRDRNRSSKVRA